MSESNEPKSYFIVKHDLVSFEALPGYIWKTLEHSTKAPKGYELVGVGDLWIAFAYEDGNGRKISQITGFFECTEASRYGDIPEFVAHKETIELEYQEDGKAWMISGKKYGEQPSHPVTVPPINKILGKPMYEQQAITEIDAEEFEKLRKVTFELEKCE
jgi:hypothetical protein